MQKYKTGVDIMENWKRDIYILANDLCLNMTEVKRIVLETNKLVAPQSENEADWKYDRAYSRLLLLIRNI